MGVHLHSQVVVSWVVISVGGQSFLFMGVPLCSWVVSFIHEHLFQCGGAPLLGWWMHVAVHGVVMWWVVMRLWGAMITHLWWLIVVFHCCSCDMAASHVKNEEVGVWGYGTHLQKQ